MSAKKHYADYSKLKVSKKGVIHHTAHAKLLERGIEFGEDIMLLDMRK